MYRMRKGIAAFIAAFFFLGAGGVAQAVIGIPDDVPGSTLLFPFFKVNPDRRDILATNTQDTLLVVTNTGGPTTSTQSGVAPNIAVHFTIWNARSVHIYDFSVVLTPHDVFSCSLYDLIVGGTGCANGSATVAPAPSGVAAQLQTTIDDETLLVGYVTADLVYSPTSSFPGQEFYPFAYGNVLVGHMYLVNLIQGSSTGFNAVSIETNFPCYGHGAVATDLATTQEPYGFYRTRCAEEQGGAQNCGLPTGLPLDGTCQLPSLAYSDFTERIDGPNGDWAQTGDAGGFQVGTTNITPDSPLGLIVRYLSLDSLNARSELWSWRDRIPSSPNLNVAVYDDAENVHSVTFSVANEVSFNSTADIITPGATDGWFRVKYLCSQFGSCSYNYNTPATGSIPPIQSVAYSVQFADNLGDGGPSLTSLRWDATFPAHRQYTNYFGVSE